MRCFCLWREQKFVEQNQQTFHVIHSHCWVVEMVWQPDFWRGLQEKASLCLGEVDLTLVEVLAASREASGSDSTLAQLNSDLS